MKEQIEKFLLSKGFKHNGDKFVISQERKVGEMIVNGVSHEQMETIQIAFKYIGTSSEEINGEWVENRTHWQFLINNHVQTEVLVENVEDFKTLFNL